MEHSESGSQNGLQGINVNDPTLKGQYYGDPGEIRDTKGSAYQRMFSSQTNRFYKGSC